MPKLQMIELDPMTNLFNQSILEMADKLQNLSSGGNITKWSLQKDNVIKQSNTQNICNTKDMMD